MKLLIVTQKVDPSDPILGFFVGWMREFAKQAEKLTILGQSVPDHPLIDKVTVLSMGKERKIKTAWQVLNFWKHILFSCRSYDAVLVHMTPIWVVLGYPLWFVLRKRVYLWYEARGTRWPLVWSLRVIQKAFSASSYGMPLATPKSVVVGHGIDTAVFAPSDDKRDEKLLVTVGRITKNKHLDVVLQTLVQFGGHYRLVIGGSTLTEEDDETLRSLQLFMQQHSVADRVLMGFQSQFQVVGLYRTAALFLHASDSGLDKTVLEAMACGCLVVSSSPALEGILPPECRSAEVSMHTVARALIDLSPAKKKALRENLRSIVQRDHSLERLVSRLMVEMKG